MTKKKRQYKNKLYKFFRVWPDAEVEPVIVGSEEKPAPGYMVVEALDAAHAIDIRFNVATFPYSNLEE